MAQNKGGKRIETSQHQGKGQGPLSPAVHETLCKVGKRSLSFCRAVLPQASLDQNLRGAREGGFCCNMLACDRLA